MSAQSFRDALKRVFSEHEVVFEQRLRELIEQERQSRSEVLSGAMRQMDQLIEHTASRDELTGLPNRSLFREHLQKAIDRVRRYKDQKYAVLFLDFDRFKLVNHSLGHVMGDRVLVSIAKRLMRVTRAVDTAARLGGDEFVLLIEQIDGIDDATRVADRLIDIFNKPHDVDGQDVTCTVSIGIVTSDDGYEHPDDILRDADTAMQCSKASGKAQHTIFEGQMHLDIRRTFDMDRALRRALERNELRLVYQPILSLEQGTICGFEALLRWRHPEMGNIPPDRFIPLAEEIGLIVSIGKWVLLEASRQLQRWQRMFPGDEPLTMNVNLSKRQLLDRWIVDTVCEAVEQTGIPPHTLKLEITESMIMDHPEEQLLPVLSSLRELGVRLCLDDFGTGHSSLSCLHRFPIDVLKIDRTFIENMEERLEFTAVVQAIVTLAHTLHMAVVAEGIETPDQLARLQTLDCDMAQGFYFARPMEVVDAETYLCGGGDRLRLTA